MFEAFAHQLATPAGIGGRIMGHVLNCANMRVVSAAVHALDPRDGSRVGDVGFGGGLGLRLLLDRVGAAGQVDGIEISATAVARADRRFRPELSAGRLRLRLGSITDLPLPDGALDSVMSVHTIYFVSDLDRAFGELARVTSRTGLVVVGLGDPEAMRRTRYARYGFRVRPVSEVIDRAHHAGLVIAEHARVGSAGSADHLLVARPGGSR